MEVGTAEGTRVQVEDLFYNLPARRKFLKSDGAESTQVSRIVTQLSLAYPDVGFTLTSGGRSVLECPPAASLRDRLYQLYGDRSDLLEVRKEAGGLRVFGYIAALADHGPTRRRGAALTFRTTIFRAVSLARPLQKTRSCRERTS
jgi:DNA mismatch repair protein MutL